MVSEHASPLATLGGVDAGGQNVHVAALAAELVRRGVAVDVFTRRDDPGLPERVTMASGVTVIHVDAGPPRSVPKDELLPHMDRFAEVLAAHFATERPDIVHAHFWMSGRAALAAARPLGIPVIQTFHALGAVKRRHQGERDTSPASRVVEEDRLASSVDHIIATCSDEVFELARLGADRRRITIVPCGVDTTLFRPDGPALARGAFGNRLVVVGRLVERKGIADVIEAVAHVPDTELLIAGGPPASRIHCEPESLRLLALARQHHVDDRVQVLGQVPHQDLPALFRSADAAVCVPWYEPFGIVPLEAMACGVPVVASAVGGLVDTVVHGVTGVQVPARRPDVLAPALCSLVSDASARRDMGIAGQRRVRSRYEWSRLAESTHDVYRRVCARTSARTSASASARTGGRATSNTHSVTGSATSRTAQVQRTGPAARQ